MPANETGRWLYFAREMERDYPQKDLYSQGGQRDKLEKIVLFEAKRLGYSKEHKIPKEIWNKLKDEGFFMIARILDKAELVDFEKNAALKHSGEKLEMTKGKIILPEKKKSIFDY